MRTMSRATRGAALTGAALLALGAVGACSDGDDDDAAGGGGAGGSAEDFCTEFSALNDEGEQLFSEGTPSADEIQDIVGRLADLDPPAEIADDFGQLIEGFTLVARAQGGDTEAQSELNQRTDDLDAADERLEPFMRDTCHIEYGD
jgi:hypothetical protein